jgi:hypothetical protein
MASGHVNRTQRPNTWLHRPTLQREDSSCQLGAVHTWPFATNCASPLYWSLPVAQQTFGGAGMGDIRSRLTRRRHNV